MDLYEILRTLHDERLRLDRIIQRLQNLRGSERTGGTRQSRLPGAQRRKETSRHAKRSRAPRRRPPSPAS